MTEHRKRTLEREAADAGYVLVPADRVAEDAGLQRALERVVGAGASRVGVRAGEGGAPSEACRLAPPIARLIDHTVLAPDTTEARVRALCAEAREHCFASVCVNPCWVPLAAEELRGAPPAVCTVIGFPFGADRAPVKAAETERAVQDGATEVDMVLNVGFLKSGRYAEAEDDVRAVVKAARGAGRTARARKATERVLVKVILETALLSDEEKVIACVLAQNAGADFVKTSTGFAKGGASPADVALMRRVVGDRMGVKASGGIRSLETAQEMVASGATRIGASASVAIVQGAEAGGNGY